MTASCGGSVGRRWTRFLLTVAAAGRATATLGGGGGCLVGLASFLSFAGFRFGRFGFAWWSVFPLAIPFQRR